jgi:hypothetical protein
MSRRWLLSVLLCQACGASAPPPAKVAPRPAPEAKQAPVAETPAAAREAAATEAAAPAAAPAPAPQSPPVLEGTVEAGEIPRPALLAVLSAGVGRFLQKVRAEPKLAGGRFVGWTLVDLWNPGTVLLPGDTVLRVNGQSIERPEQFKNVWDSLATESELVLLVERSGHTGQVRYRIVD